jgi:hypothetical protein
MFKGVYNSAQSPLMSHVTCYNHLESRLSVGFNIILGDIVPYASTYLSGLVPIGPVLAQPHQVLSVLIFKTAKYPSIPAPHDGVE